MLHLVTRQAPEIPVVFIDTGYLFPETYRFAEQLTERLNLNLKTYQSRVSPARQEALFGKRWEQGTEELDRYNLLNKVEPMDRAVRELGAEAWLAGLRRSHLQEFQECPPSHHDLAAIRIGFRQQALFVEAYRNLSGGCQVCLPRLHVVGIRGKNGMS
jgi:phosphoadenylyl-sulfate reductase (thioredoxin)